jgi:hypothetical protein
LSGYFAINTEEPDYDISFFKFEMLEAALKLGVEVAYLT